MKRKTPIRATIVIAVTILILSFASGIQYVSLLQAQPLQADATRGSKGVDPVDEMASRRRIGFSAQPSSQPTGDAFANVVFLPNQRDADSRSSTGNRGPFAGQVVSSANHGTQVQKLWAFGAMSRPPSSDALALVIVDEGQIAEIRGQPWSVDRSQVTDRIEVTVGDVILNDDGSWSWRFQTGDGPEEIQQVTITATSGDGTSASLTFDLIVHNVPPQVHLPDYCPIETRSSWPAGPVRAGTPIALEAVFVEPGLLDAPHTAVWDWGDGSTCDTRAGQACQLIALSGTDPYQGVVTGSHAYVHPGVYAVTLTVTDADGGIGASVLGSVIVTAPKGQK